MYEDLPLIPFFLFLSFFLSASGVQSMFSSVGETIRRNEQAKS
jgi:hypothetical protein